MADNLEFDDLESVEQAIVAKDNAIADALKSGKNESEIALQGKLAYSKSRRQSAIDFCKKFEDKLNKLSDQSLAALLRALVAMGLNIEDDEEFEYWYNFLESLSRQRVMMYFIDRNGLDNKGRLQRKPKSGNEILLSTQNYSIRDMVGLSSLVSEMIRIHSRKNKSDDKRMLLLKGIKKYIDNDLKLKQRAQRNKIKPRTNKSTNKPQNRSQRQIDWLTSLKNKMIEAGVKSDGGYWNHVISEYEMSAEKAKFVRDWSIDAGIMQRLESGRDIDSNNNDKVNSDTINNHRHNETATQRENIHRQAQSERENKALTDRQQKQMYQRQQEELTSNYGRQEIEKEQEKKGRDLNKKEMAIIKMKVAGKSGR